MSSSNPSTTEDISAHLKTLATFSACDISDALLAISPTLPQSGFLTNILPLTTSTLSAGRIVAEASTLKLVRKYPHPDHPAPPEPLPKDHECAIPSDQHWVDMTPPNRILLIESAPNSYAASIGGIMALRMSLRQVTACIISGRARDQAELEATHLPIWASGKSSVATGAEQKVWGRECEIEIEGVKVQPGDVVVADAEEGCCVVVPRGLVGEVVDRIGGMVERDERVVEAVRGGMSVKEAFGRFRGKDTRA